MAVLTEYTIGDPIPASVTIALEQLGGDGWTSPLSCYDVQLQETGDATGGNMTLVIYPDPQWLTVVGIVSAGNDAATDKPMRLAVIAPVLSLYQVVTPIKAAIAGGAAMWYPPGLVLETIPGRSSKPYVAMTYPNTNGELGQLRVRYFNFQKRAKELVPLEQLFQVLGRSSSTS